MRDQILGVVEKEQAEIEQRARDRLAVHKKMLFIQVPPARTNEQRGNLFIELVALPFRADVGDGAIDGVAKIEVPVQIVRPRRRIRVLEIGHEHVRARIERVDNHLPVDRPGDFHATVHQIRGNGGDGPFRLANVLGFGQEVGQFPRVDPRLPLDAAPQAIAAFAPRMSESSFLRKATASSVSTVLCASETGAVI